MSMHADWVDRIFARLAVRYGATWLRQWEGIDMAAVKADWAEQLGGVNGDQVGFALRYLPAEFPPTAAVFRAQALRMPEVSNPLLTAPREPIPPRIATALADVARQQSKRHPKQWAHDLAAREKAGERLSITQRTMWRAALADSDGTNVSMGGGVIAPSALPPGMRPDAPRAETRPEPAEPPVYADEDFR